MREVYHDGYGDEISSTQTEDPEWAKRRGIDLYQPSTYLILISNQSQYPRDRQRSPQRSDRHPRMNIVRRNNSGNVISSIQDTNLEWAKQSRINMNQPPEPGWYYSKD